MTKLEDFKSINLVPNYLRNNTDVIALTEAYDKQFHAIRVLIEKLNLLKRLFEGTLEDFEIDLLMKENHVDYWDRDLTREKKLELIKSSYENHKIKGTRFSIENQLSIILKKYELLEWFQFKDSIPGTFKVVTEGKMPVPSEVEKIFKIININKNLSSHLIGFIVSSKLNQNMNNGFVRLTGGRNIIGIAKKERTMTLKTEVFNNYVGFDSKYKKIKAGVI